MSATTSRKARRERLRITERIIHELGTVYEEPTEVIRELIQNAVDAGASKIHIDVNEDELRFRHNGRPIKGKELEAFLTVGTDYKAKRKGKYVGFWGIGRLSWMMIGNEAHIYTGNKHLIWRADNPMDIMVLPSEKEVKGVEWVIKLKPSTYLDLTPRDIKSYISTHFIGAPEIYVNDGVNGYERVEGASSNSLLLFNDGKNKVYLDLGALEDVFTSSGRIFRDNFLIGNEYDLPYLIVLTGDDRVMINPSRHIVKGAKYYNWIKYIAEKSVNKLYRLLRKGVITPDQYMKVANRLISENFYFDPESNLSVWKLFLLKKVSRGDNDEYVLLKDVIRRPRKYLFIENGSSLDDTSLKRLEEMRKVVVELPESGATARAVKEILSKHGVRDVKEFIIKNKAFIETRLRKISRDLSDLFSTIKEFTDKALFGGGAIGGMGKARRKRGKGVEREVVGGGVRLGSIDIGGKRVDVEARVSKGEKEIVMKLLGGSKASVVRAEIQGEDEGLPITFVKFSNRSTMAFNLGGKIYINVLNPEVKRMIELHSKLPKDERMLLWAPLIIHEYLHSHGLDHGEPEWSDKYESAIRGVITHYLRKKAVQG